MKAKLIKRVDGYYIKTEEPLNGVDLACYPWNIDKQKLSKQNCDELFGVVDVEKLAEDYAKSQCEDLFYEAGKTGAEWGWETSLDFKNGFNKAMELNKGKLFTEDDMIAFALKFSQLKDGEFFKGLNELVKEYSQQPTEIEVEIEMEEDKDTLVDNVEQFLKDLGDKPKLDSEGCLILKKV